MVRYDYRADQWRRAATGNHDQPRPRAATGTTGGQGRPLICWQRPLGEFIFVLICFGIRRDEQKEIQNINVMGKMDLAKQFGPKNGVRNKPATFGFSSDSSMPRNNAKADRHFRCMATP